MAVLMAAQRLRLRLLPLPPSTRASVFAQPIFKRSFSSTNARRDLATTIASGPALLLDTLHAFVPWYIAIPTTAVLVRGVLVYYVVSLPNRRRAITRRYLYPLWDWQARNAWAQYEHRQFEAHREQGSIGPATAVLMYVRRIWTNAGAAHTTGRLYGAPVFSTRPLLNFGMMIAFTEALRIKCGARVGLLPTLLYPIEWARDTFAEPVPRNTGAVDTTSMTQDELLAQRLEMAHEAQQAGMLPEGLTDTELLQQSHHLSPLNAPEYAAHLDPTLQAEGLSWCSDLTAVDPTFGLPIALSVTIAASAFLRSSRADLDRPAGEASDASPNKPAKPDSAASWPPQQKPPRKPTANEFQAALEVADQLRAAAPVKNQGPLAGLALRQQVTLTIALLFLHMGIKLPAAILLYLVPSFLVGVLQSRWLDMKYPLPAMIRPSKRPMRVKVRKTFGDV